MRVKKLIFAISLPTTSLKVRIANLLVALLLVSPLLWGTPQSTIEKMDLISQVCFVQPEISGRMNVEESKVEFSNHQSATLMGGQAACLYVTPGDYSFRIEFLNSEKLFDHTSESPKYNVTLAKRE